MHNLLRRLVQVLYQGAWFRMIKWLVPMAQEAYYFNAWNGSHFNDNPRAIFDELVKHKPQAQYFVLLENEQEAAALKAAYPKVAIETIHRHSQRFFFALAKARVWVINVNMPWRLKPRKNGIVLQAWHGTPLKRIGLDLPDSNAFKAETAKEPLNWTYFISNAASDNQLYQSAFGLKPEQLQAVGLPRNDYLVAHQHDLKLQATIKRSLKLPEAESVWLYAPTFRDDDQGFALALDLQRLSARFPNAVLLLRLHPNVAGAISQLALPDNVVNVSDYPDIRDLYLISDRLITDYSSVFFDYALLKRPVIFYPYDLDHYQDSLRGFYFDYRQFVPGPIVTTQSELEEALAGALPVEPVANFASAHNANLSGQASKAAVNLILPK